MGSQKCDIGLRFQSAFSLSDEVSRSEAIVELLDVIDAGEEDIEEGINEFILGLKTETSERVLGFIWGRLSRMRYPYNKIRAFAESELDNPVGLRRWYALQYLARAFPQDGERLYKKMAEDSNPFVLFEAGKAILSLNPRLSVELWDRAMDLAPSVLADEVLPVWIGQYADQEFIAKIEKRVVDHPYDTLSQLILWQARKWSSLEYLDAEKPVDPGEGYIIKCLNCKKELGVRNGHGGERGRCRYCHHEFIIPDNPKF